MGEEAIRLLEEVLRLPLHERAGMTAEILASLDEPVDSDAEVAWAREAEVRARRALANPDGGTAWEVVSARIEDNFAKDDEEAGPPRTRGRGRTRSGRHLVRIATLRAWP
jgi:hypothetical protein